MEYTKRQQSSDTPQGYVTISKHMDCAHRVINHVSKCRNYHGHSYLYDLTFQYDQLQDIGYSIDFAELKRVGVQWIEDFMDHGAILNPHDTAILKTCVDLDSKLWLMSLNGYGEFCNPSVENIVKEVFLAMEILFEDYPHLRIFEIKMNETPNCYTQCYPDTITAQERLNFRTVNYDSIKQYALNKGVVEYDSSKV